MDLDSRRIVREAEGAHVQLEKAQGQRGAKGQYGQPEFLNCAVLRREPVDKMSKKVAAVLIHLAQDEYFERFYLQGDLKGTLNCGHEMK